MDKCYNGRCFVDMAWPNFIKVQGLPFVLQGWNTTFYKTTEVSEDAPVYRLNSYVLYWVFIVDAARIEKINGMWILRRECDAPDDAFLRKQYAEQVTPIGIWSHGATVIPD